MNLKWVESLFHLSEEQNQLVLELEHYDVYFSMLRYDFVENATGISAVVDFFFYLYQENTPNFNSQIVLYYPLRYFVVEKTIEIGNLERLKHYTVGHMDRSLIAAVLITNIMLDVYREIRPFFTSDEIQFIWKYVKRPKRLFDLSFQNIEQYPRKYVQIETKMMQVMRKYIEDNPEIIKVKTQKMHRFMDAYVYEQKQLFDKGII